MALGAPGAVLLLLVVCSLFYYLASTWCVLDFFVRDEGKDGGGERKSGPAARPESARQAAVQFPPVSVIKPVAGAEPGHLENFVSLCNQDYPRYEIVFSTSDANDPALAVVEELKERYPDRDIRWVLTRNNRGPNYKVGNLISAIGEARYDTLVINDSDMRFEPDYLQRVVGGLLRDGVGVVTCLYRGVGIRSIPAALQSLFIQTDFIPNVLLGRKLEGISYGFGSTICTTRTMLKAIGGLEPISEYLADDYQIANRIHRLGYSVHLPALLVDHVSTVGSFRDYFLQHLRWGITQKASRPGGYAASIVTHGTTLATLLLILSGFSFASAALFLLVLGVRFLTFAFINRAVVHNDEIMRYAWLLPLKDLLNSAVWLLSLLTSTVRWRHRRFRLLPDGKMVEAP